jgi:hypothetical protein
MLLENAPFPTSRARKQVSGARLFLSIDALQTHGMDPPTVHVTA